MFSEFEIMIWHKKFKLTSYMTAPNCAFALYFQCPSGVSKRHSGMTDLSRLRKKSSNILTFSWIGRLAAK